MLFDSLTITIVAIFIGSAGTFGVLWFFKSFGQRKLHKREAIALWALTVVVIFLTIYSLTTDFGKY